MRATDNDHRTTEQIFTDAGFVDAERADVIRRGEREPISKLVRQMVYRRDGWTCQHCGATPFHRGERRSGALHLDHIVPWSAGGSDKSDNLRTLCGPCNMERSNFVTARDRSAMPIARICAPCLTMAGFKPDNTFEVYCACRHHVSWALPGWHIM